MSSHLLHHGIVHSVTDPYATALLVADGVVAWLGADDSAEHVAGPEVERVDLDGAVVAPAFVEPWGTADDAADAARRGTAVVTVLAAPGETSPAPAEGVRTVRYRAAGTPDPQAAGLWLPVGGDLDDAALAAALVEATDAGEQAYLVPAAGPDGPAADRAQAGALAALRAVAAERGAPALGRVRHRLVLTGPVSAEDRAFLASVAAAVTVAPDADGVLRAPVASLLADAVPVCLSAGPARDPWAAVRAALAHPDADERISARSAFTAATRTGLRALPDVPAAVVDASPRLAVSVPATFAVWSAEAVTVQSPDGRVAAWSTDTRAGTPLLPALDAETPLPTWIATWADGRVVAQATDARPADA